MEKKVRGCSRMARSMDNKVFQDIFDILQPVLPKEWKKLLIFIGYTEGSYTMKYHTCNESGVYIDCFSQKEINRAQLIGVFMNIDKIVSPQRKDLDEKNRWTVMTMIVDSEGNMKSEFDYTDISEIAIQYKREWEKKYLV